MTEATTMATPINLLANLEPGTRLRPLVLTYDSSEGERHYGAIMDDSNFVVWRAAIPRTTAQRAASDAIQALDDYTRR